MSKTICAEGVDDRFLHRQIEEGSAPGVLREKQGRRVGRVVLGPRQGHAYVKVYPAENRSGPPPALVEWQNIGWAIQNGIPTARPRSAGQLADGRSLVVVDELRDMIALHQAIPRARRQLNAAAFHGWKKLLAREVARLSRLLHDAGRYHKDLYLCHFFIRSADISQTDSLKGRIALIDFRRLARHPLTGPRWRIKDLAQLLFSSDLPGIGKRDRLRFWCFYRGPRSRAGRLWLKWIRRKADRYRKSSPVLRVNDLAGADP